MGAFYGGADPISRSGMSNSFGVLQSYLGEVCTALSRAPNAEADWSCSIN